MFFMAGWMKVFQMGPVEHARGAFIGGFSETWIPDWLLWGLGTVIPFVELAGGILLCAGLFITPAAVSMGGILIVVTYGHLLHEPLYTTTAQIFPRLVLLLLVLIIPRDQDRLSLDYWFFHRRNRWFQRPAPPPDREPGEPAA
jgi:uncharacterized membrane protein YphA (DoxX/SURF4 family)